MYNRSNRSNRSNGPKHQNTKAVKLRVSAGKLLYVVSCLFHVRFIFVSYFHSQFHSQLASTLKLTIFRMLI